MCLHEPCAFKRGLFGGFCTSLVHSDGFCLAGFATCKYAMSVVDVRASVLGAGAGAGTSAGTSAGIRAGTSADVIGILNDAFDRLEDTTAKYLSQVQEQQEKQGEQGNCQEQGKQGEQADYAWLCSLSAALMVQLCSQFMAAMSATQFVDHYATAYALALAAAGLVAASGPAQSQHVRVRSMVTTCYENLYATANFLRAVMLQRRVVTRVDGLSFGFSFASAFATISAGSSASPRLHALPAGSNLLQDSEVRIPNGADPCAAACNAVLQFRNLVLEQVARSASLDVLTRCECAASLSVVPSNTCDAPSNTCGAPLNTCAQKPQQHQLQVQQPQVVQQQRVQQQQRQQQQPHPQAVQHQVVQQQEPQVVQQQEPQVVQLYSRKKPRKQAWKQQPPRPVKTVSFAVPRAGCETAAAQLETRGAAPPKQQCEETDSVARVSAPMPLLASQRVAVQEVQETAPMPVQETVSMPVQETVPMPVQETVPVPVQEAVPMPVQETVPVHVPEDNEEQVDKEEDILRRQHLKERRKQEKQAALDAQFQRAHRELTQAETAAMATAAKAAEEAARREQLKAKRAREQNHACAVERQRALEQKQLKQTNKLAREEERRREALELEAKRKEEYRQKQDAIQQAVDHMNNTRKLRVVARSAKQAREAAKAKLMMLKGKTEGGGKAEGGGSSSRAECGGRAEGGGHRAEGPSSRAKGGSSIKAEGGGRAEGGSRAEGSSRAEGKGHKRDSKSSAK